MTDPNVFINEYASLARRVDVLRARPDVEVRMLDVLRRSGYGLPFFMLRRGPKAGPQICISGSVHGDEPAGAEAVLQLFERPHDGHIGIIALPCLNPTGYVAGNRHNDIGYDLNRTFGQDPAPIETTLVRQAVAGQWFDMALDLHEDVDAQGFYLYEHVRTAQAAIGSRVIQHVRSLGYSIQGGDEIDGRSLKDGCVAPADEVSSPTNGYFSIFLFNYNTDHTISPETPAAQPLPVRAAMHLAVIDYVVETLAGRAL